MASLIEKLRAYSYNKQYLGRQGESFEQIINGIIGVYSPHPSTALSLFARVKSFSVDDFHRLDSDQIGFRVPSMRGSVYMLPSQDAFKVMSATLAPSNDPSWEKRYSQPGRIIPTEHYDDWKASSLNLLSVPMTVKEIKAVSEVPGELLKFILNRMCLERSLLRVGSKSLKSNIISYVAAKSWGAGDVVDHDKTQYLKWLAEKYLSVFGPVRIKDFQWWAGITLTLAKEAFSTIQTQELEDDLLILPNKIEEFESVCKLKNDAIDILPQWDSYTMGYAPDGRERLVSPDMQHHIYGKLGATGGNGLGTILINGLAHGSWNSRFKGTTMQISINMFEKTSTSVQTKIEGKFLEIAQLLSAKKIELT